MLQNNHAKPLTVRDTVRSSNTSLFTVTPYGGVTNKLNSSTNYKMRIVPLAATSKTTRLSMKSDFSKVSQDAQNIGQYLGSTSKFDTNQPDIALNKPRFGSIVAPQISQKTSVNTISSQTVPQKSFNPVNYMSYQIESVRNKNQIQTKTLPNVPQIQAQEAFEINQLADGHDLQINYQDRLFHSSQSPLGTSNSVYPSLLRRTHLNVYKDVQKRMSVVMQASTLTEVDVLTEEAEETAEAKSMPLLPKKYKGGKLAVKLIKRMEKENIREERESVEIPTLGPLGDKKFWDFKVFPKLQKSWSQMNKKDQIVAGLIGSIHALALAAPFTASAGMFKLFFAGYLVNCFGITMCFHRQLTHRSFETDQWLENIFAFCGILGVQGHPIEWVSAHRHHHQQCDDIADPHSPYDGFWWSHMGWMFDSNSQALLFDTTNAKDLKRNDFYLWAKKHYLKITLAQPLVYFAFGGFPAVVWGFALRTVFCWHITWAVNSVSHVWGRQMFKTDDLSMNNPLIGVLAMGEGWHNNHHAFEASCRHGLKWWQIDGTWYVILLLEKLGLARKLQYPNEERMKKLAWD